MLVPVQHTLLLFKRALASKALALGPTACSSPGVSALRHPPPPTHPHTHPHTHTPCHGNSSPCHLVKRELILNGLECDPAAPIFCFDSLQLQLLFQ